VAATPSRKRRKIARLAYFQRRILNSAYFPMSELHSQLFQQRLGLFKIRQVEAFGEPVINFAE
jgi:hypothetical protein